MYKNKSTEYLISHNNTTQLSQYHVYYMFVNISNSLLNNIYLIRYKNANLYGNSTQSIVNY